MDLDSLKFVVETNDLEKAIVTIDKLASTVANFNTVQKQQTANDTAAAAASIANSNAKKAEFEAMEAQSKALGAEINLKKKLEQQNKETAKSQAEVNKTNEDSVPATDKASSAAEKLVKRQELISKFLGEELTRGAAGTLASFKLLGTGTEELESRLRKALDLQISLGKNPFDSNIGAIKSVNQEFEALTNRANLLTAGISLNSKQLFEYSRIAQEISARLASAGIDVKSIQGQELFNKTLKESQAAYLDAAAKVNVLKEAEKTRNDALKVQEKEDARRAREALTFNDQAVVLFRKNEEAKAQAALNSANQIIEANKGIQESINRTNAIAAMVKNGVSQQEATQRFDLAAKGIDQQAINNYINSTKALAQAEKERRDASLIGNTVLTKAEKEREAAIKRVVNEEEKMISVLKTLNDAEGNVHKATERSARSIANYEKNLRQAGIAGEEYSAKLAKYRQQQEQLSIVEEKRQVNFLQRGLQPQIGDIAVSLASGQRPLTVLLQQGDQIRGLIVQTGLEGEALKKAFEGALSGVVTSIKQTAGAVLDLLGGAVKSVAVSIKDAFVGTIQLAVAGLKDLRDGTFTSAIAIERLKVAFGTLSKVALIGAITALTTLGYQLYTISKQEDELTKNLNINGASLGLNTTQAIAYAKSLDGIKGGTTKVLDVISAMATKGGFVAADIGLVTKAAIELERVGGVAIDKTVETFAKLKDKPVEALTELAMKTGLIPVASLKAVQALVMQGRESEAAAVAFKAYADSIGTQTDNITREYSKIGKAALFLADSFKTLVNGFKDLIYTTSGNDALIERGKILDQQIAKQREYDKYRNTVSRIFGQAEGKSSLLISLEAERKLIQDQLFDRLRSADAESVLKEEQSKAAKTLAETEKYRLLSLTEIQKKEQEILRIEGEIQVQKAKGKASNSDEIRYRELVIKKLRDEINISKNPAIGFTNPNGNDESNLTKQYKSDLAVITKISEDQRRVLKDQYDERIIDRQMFVTQDLELLRTSNIKQLNLAEQYEKSSTDIYVKSIQNAIRERDKALASTQGKPDQLQKSQQINEQYIQYLNNLGNSFASTTNDIANFRRELESSITQKQSDILKTFYEDAKANQTANEKFLRSRIELIEARKIEADLQDQLAGKSDAEKARLMAMAAAQKAYSSEIIRTKEVLDKASDAFEQSLQNPFATDSQIKAANDARLSAAKIVEDTIAQSRVDIENEGTNAILKYYKDESLKFQNDLADNITESITSGGKGGAKKFRQLIIAELNKPVTIVVRAVVQTLLGGVSGAIGNLLGGSTGASNGSTVGSLASIGQGVSSAYKLVSGGLNVAAQGGSYLNDVGTQLYKLGQQGVGSAIGQFGVGLSNGTSSLGGFGQAFQAGGAELAGAIAGSVLNGFSGYGISKFISGGYKTGLFGSSLDKIGGIASAIPGIGPIAGVITGVINRLFGRKLKKVGIEGEFSGEDEFEGNNFKYYKGGVFSSNKTKRSPLSEETKTALGERFGLLRESTLALGETLGLGSMFLDNFTYKIKLNFKGLNQEEVEKKLEDTFSSISLKMADLALGSTKYKQANETSVETLTRLSSNIVGFNKVLDSLGIAAFQASLANADLAGRIIEAAGGLSNFGSLTTSFYQNYFTSTEKTALVTKNLTSEFAKLGVTTLPKTREEFRQLVAGLDLTTAQGQKSFLGFLALGDSLSSILPPLEDASTAADTLRNAFQSLTDGIFDEVARIRGLLNEGTPNSLANAQSDFAIATAQARAGDQTAAGNLPQLSQNLLALAEDQAGSSVDLKRIQNQVLLSLQGTGLYLSNKYGTTVPTSELGGIAAAGGLPSVAPVPPTMSSTGTNVVTAGTSGTLANNSRLEDLVQILQQSVENLRAEVRADVTANTKIANILTRVNQDGETINVTVI